MAIDSFLSHSGPLEFGKQTRLLSLGAEASRLSQSFQLLHGWGLATGTLAATGARLLAPGLARTLAGAATGARSLAFAGTRALLMGAGTRAARSGSARHGNV